MFKERKFFFNLVILTFLMLFTYIPTINAQEATVLKFGQKNLITECSSTEHWDFSPDGTDYDYGFYNNGGFVSVTAPIGACLGIIGTYLNYDYIVDYGDKIWGDISGVPVKITYEFSYEISVSYMEGYGSADAEIKLPENETYFNGPWYDGVGHVFGISGTKSASHQTESIVKSLGQLGETGTLKFLIRAAAGRPSTNDDENGPLTHSADSNLTVHKIIIEIGRGNASFEYVPSDPQVSESVNFFSTSDDPNKDTWSYEWRITDLAEDGGVIGIFTTETFSYKFPQDSLYEVSLTVSDGIESDTTIQNVRVITPPPEVDVEIDSLITMGHPYKIKFIIDNNARVPIYMRINQKEIREQLGIELLWDPFANPIDPLAQYNIITEEISPIVPKEIFLPYNPFKHKWKWVDPEHWMNLVRKKIIIAIGNDIADVLYGLQAGNPATILLKQVLNIFDSIEIEELADQQITSVDYLITDQGNKSSWWVYESDSHDISIPDRTVTNKVSEYKRISLDESYANMQLAFRFFAISGEFYGNVSKIQDLFNYISSGSVSLNPFTLVNIVRAGITGAYLTISNENFRTAKDPPDFNYTELAAPENIEWPEVNELPDCLGKDLVIKHLELLSLHNAHSISLDRYEGAKIDENVECIVKQLEVASYYSKLINEKIIELIPYYKNLASLLPEVDDQMIQMFKDKVASEGISQLVRDIIIRETELSSYELDDIENMYLTINDNWLKNNQLILYLLLFNSKLSDDIARDELNRLIDLKINLLGETVKDPTQDELDNLVALRDKVFENIANGNYDSNLLENIYKLKDYYEEVLKRTNNNAAIELFANVVYSALGNMPLNVIFNGLNGECVMNEDCDDADLCTTDSCVDSACVFEPVDCDDGNLCTNDSCDSLTGECQHVSVNCDDGDPCTVDSCDPAIGCQHEPMVCNDADLCTTDSCVDGQCVFEPVDCDDGDLCTNDYCDPDTGVCVHEPIGCEINEILGDLDGDCDVDFYDFGIFRNTLGKCTGDAGFIAEADYDEDGCITYADYRIWYGYYRNQ